MRNKKRADRIAIQKMIDYCGKVEILLDRFGGTLEKSKRREIFTSTTMTACDLI